MAFSSVEGLLAAARTKPVWEAVLEDDCNDRGVERSRSLDQMAALWAAMAPPVTEYDPAPPAPAG